MGDFDWSTVPEEHGIKKPEFCEAQFYPVESSEYLDDCPQLAVEENDPNPAPKSLPNQFELPIQDVYSKDKAVRDALQVKLAERRNVLREMLAAASSSDSTKSGNDNLAVVPSIPNVQVHKTMIDAFSYAIGRSLCPMTLGKHVLKKEHKNGQWITHLSAGRPKNINPNRIPFDPTRPRITMEDRVMLDLENKRKIREEQQLMFKKLRMEKDAGKC